MPLPIMALLRLNTDIPNDVFPSNCKKGARPRYTEVRKVRLWSKKGEGWNSWTSKRLRDTHWRQKGAKK